MTDLAAQGIEQSWARVTSWLRRNAPGSYRALRPPATTAELAAAQNGLDVAIPDDLLLLLSMTNGSAADDPDPALQFGSRFLPGRHFADERRGIQPQNQMLTEILADLDDFMVRSWWHPAWVPFASHVAADALVIDQRPGAGQGAVGEFSHWTVKPPSIGAVAAHFGRRAGRHAGGATRLPVLPPDRRRRAAGLGHRPRRFLTTRGQLVCGAPAMTGPMWIWPPHGASCAVISRKSVSSGGVTCSFAAVGQAGRPRDVGVVVLGMSRRRSAPA